MVTVAARQSQAHLDSTMKVLLIAALVAVAAARPQEYHDDVFHFSSKVNHENLARPSIVSSVPVVKSVVPQYQQYSQYSQYPQYQQYNQYAQYPQYQQYKQYSQYAQYPQYQQYNQYVQSVPAYSHSHSHVHAAHHVVEQPSVLFRSVEQEVPAVTAVHTTHVHQPAVYSQVAAVHKEVAPVVSRASVVPQYHHGVETYTKILKQVQEFDPAGIYRADYATENGITAAEQGTVKDINAKEGPVAAKEGSYSYTGPDGVLYSVNWVADEFGFRASGAHLPGAEEIKKSVDLIASQPQKYDAEGNLVYKQF